ncbi:MAG: nuclear transport factor 2 family protein [Chloroflexota bacterium]
MSHTPEHIVEQFFTALETMDMDTFFALWADDGRQEMPFAPDGFPRELNGIDAIRRQYGGLPDAYDGMNFPRTIRSLRETGWVFVEYQGEISLKSGGTYNNDYCGSFHVVDGKIVLFREFFNPIILQSAFGKDITDTFSIDAD